MKVAKTHYALGGNKQPVFVTEDLAFFRRCWQWRIGTHKTTDVFVLIDENVAHIYPNFTDSLFNSLPVRLLQIIPIPSLELNKSWNKLTEIIQIIFKHPFDRKAVLVGIGGGIICDLAGFAASIIKRGIRLVLMPTTLLSMTDAAIGGKNGINFDLIKNQVGTTYIPHFVFVYYPFLLSLPQEHLLSGYAEMLKHALIADSNLYKNFHKTFFPDLPPISWLAQSIRIKLRFTKKDPFERNIRKLLNFGHTLGHAFESYFAEIGSPITHGHAVALGMKEELFFSKTLTSTATGKLNEVGLFIDKHFPSLPPPPWKAIEKYLLHDKKKSHVSIDMVLIENIGKAVMKSIDLIEVKQLHEQYCTI